MKKLSKDVQEQKAKEFGLACAESIFKDFQNPLNRGSNFKWENFPILVSEVAKTTCFTNFPHRVNIEIKEIARASAFFRAKELIGHYDEI